MPKYVADFKLSGSLEVRATNLQEAQTAAEELLCDIVQFWNDNNPYPQAIIPVAYIGKLRLSDTQADKDNAN